jgi:hypothetical protein
MVMAAGESGAGAEGLLPLVWLAREVSSHFSLSVTKWLVSWTMTKICFSWTVTRMFVS